MNYVILIEGQNIQVPEEIGANDEAVKRALTPFYPEAANALITRVTKDDTVTVSVVKRAGSKGAAVDALVACAGGKNPAIALYEELEGQENAGGLDPMAVLEMGPRIDAALVEGEKQAQAVKQAAERLERAAARPAPMVLAGF